MWLIVLTALLSLGSASTANLDAVLANNQAWVTSKTNNDSAFFSNHYPSQSPKYLYIGCSDSRVPPNLLLGLDVGEVFVIRNIANVASASDKSTMAVIQYSVEVLKVTDILVVGHYGCGGVKASLTVSDHGMLEFYLSRLRHLSRQHATELNALSIIDEKTNRLVELNVDQQVLNVAAMPFVQNAWAIGQTVRVHGLVYNMQNGLLINRNNTMYQLSQLPASLAITSNLVNINTVISNNRAWVAAKTSNNSAYFSNLYPSQSPKYLYIGCSDSRVPPNLLMGLEAG